MTDRKLRVGLVGAGAIAQVAELPALAAQPGLTIAGVVTKTGATARENVERWPIERAYDSFEDMLEAARLDALFILTPKQSHTEFVVGALNFGLDVFCEKPLATTIADAQAMAEAAERTGKILMVGFNRRYAEVYRRAHDEFAEQPPDFCVAQKNRVGSEYRATLENAIHMVDLMRWFCGEAESVAAHAVAHDPYAEEGTMALIRFTTGSVGVLVASRSAGEWDERVDLYGGLRSVRVVVPDAVSVTAGGETRTVEMRPRANGWAEVNTTMGFGPEVEHFLDCVKERRQPLTDGREAVKTQLLMEEILRAAGLPLEDRNEATA
jgi:virulence factor